MIPLRAGPLQGFYDEGDLRDLSLKGRTLCLRIYAAVRDRNWGTIPAARHDETIDIQPDRFRITYAARHCAGEIDFLWRATLTGDPDGRIVFDFDGEARTTFLRNRIGFCVLHPAACAGAHCRVDHIDGTVSDAPLPARIDPDQPVLPFARMRGLTMALPGGAVAFTFEGDTFEMEDQRNWTDASYKTFCTPLSLPYPVEIAAGTRVRQRITLAPVAAPAPAVGLGMAAWSPELTPEQAIALRRLRPAHLRVDLLLAGPWRERLARARREAALLDCPLEVALLLDPARPEPLEAVRAELDAAPVARYLVLPAAQSPGVAPPYDALADAFRAAFGDAPLFLGTDSDFLFVNRYPPPMARADGLSLAINPQVHAFDDRSLMETLEVQAAVVADARRRAGGKPVAISPVTLLPRWNPYAATPGPRDAEPASDPRQGGAFAAEWTRRSLAQLAGAGSVTYFETHGPRGLLGTPAAEVLAEREWS